MRRERKREEEQPKSKTREVDWESGLIGAVVVLRCCCF